MSELLRRTLGERIAIETALGGSVWQTFADPNQLENALLNLAVNARDAVPLGGVLTIGTANVTLDEAYARAEEGAIPGEYVMIAVADSGGGMSKETVERAFEPFFTTKEVGQGTGLGLSQVYGFVKQSGGHVKIESALGAGTTVRLYLPRHEGEPARQGGARPRREMAATGGETVLLVEDEDAVRRHCAGMLRELGYRVLDARDGRTALGLLAAEPEIRLLFTDVGLPGDFNGRELADAALKLRPALKVLFTTGYARDAIVHEGRLDPGIEVLLKPFTRAALAPKVREILGA